MSVPNQKRVRIKKSNEIPFLKIGIKEWTSAQKVLPKSAFVLYLYLAGNGEGFNLELSFQAFKNATGYSKASYHRAVNELINHNYIYLGENGLEFAPSPVSENPWKFHNWELDDSDLRKGSLDNEIKQSQIKDPKESRMNTEIKNKEKQRNNKENKEADPFGDITKEQLDSFFELGFVSEDYYEKRAK